MVLFEEPMEDLSFRDVRGSGRKSRKSRSQFSTSLLVEPPRQKRCWVKAMDDLVAPGEDECDAIFVTAQREGAEIFFQHLAIRNNGGLRKQRAADDFYSNLRLAQAVSEFGFISFNFFTVIRGLVSVLQNSSNEAIKNTFLLLIDRDLPHAARIYWVVRLLISIFEVGAMLSMAAYALYVLLKYVVLAKGEQRKQYRLWHQLYVVCCLGVHTMVNFSAMRSLHYLNPQTFAPALSLALAKVEEGTASFVRVVGGFALKRLCLGILGFLAFVVKFSQLVLDLRHLVDEQEYGVEDFLHQVVLLFGFVNQVFGITQIWHIETNRVFLFIFGGEDAQLMTGDIERRDAYLASAMHFICTALYTEVQPDWRRGLRRAVAMLTFSHLDIQSLVVEDDEDLEVTASSIRSGDVQRRTLRISQGETETAM